jgi:hypothetical protein
MVDQGVAARAPEGGPELAPAAARALFLE